MIEKVIVKARPPVAPVAPTEGDLESAERVAVELDEIVGRSQRRSPLRRALHRVGGALARWLDNLAPPARASDDQELPQIRFPFF